MVLLILLAAFAQVSLGCLQSINVVEQRKVWTFFTSIAQGITALTLYRHASHVETYAAVLAFLFGGVLGGQFAMYVARSRKQQWSTTNTAHATGKLPNHQKPVRVAEKGLLQALHLGRPPRTPQYQEPTIRTTRLP